MKIFIGFILLFVFAQCTSAQTCPKVSTKGRKITSITNLNSDLKSDETCRITSHTGTIKALTYDDENTTEVIAITIQIQNQKRIFVGLDDIESCLSEADKPKYRNQLKTGAKVRIKTFCCGQSSDCDLQIFSIEFL